MKIGDVVTYCDSSGNHKAFVVGVVGSGRSGWKILNVDLEDGRGYKEVSNHRDAKPGEGHWRMNGDEELPEYVARATEPEPKPKPAPAAKKKAPARKSAAAAKKTKKATKK